MATTQLFVELVVVGFGALGWSTALAVAVFGTAWLSGLADLDAVVVAAPILALAYLLGIVLDRVADAAFEPAVRRYKRKAFDEEATYVAARRATDDDERLARRFEYGRSRLRICRGWALNCAVAIPVVTALVLRRAEPSEVAGLLVPLLAGTAALLAACVFAWRSLAVAQYREIRAWLPDGPAPAEP
ncbi:MAG: hypothetical protein ACOH10_11615 [Rhodoglobus sp.]